MEDISVVVPQSNIHGWNEDVKLFYLHDVETDEKIASFYLDPFKRRNKVTGAFAAPIIFKQQTHAQVSFTIQTYILLKWLVCGISIFVFAIFIS